MCPLCRQVIEWFKRTDTDVVQRTTLPSEVANVHGPSNVVSFALFTEASSQGRLQDVQTLAHEMFRPGVAIDSSPIVRACILACANGHVETARWLHEHFGLSGGHILGRSCFALNAACGGGHLPTVVWLVETFNVHGDHLNILGGRPICMAAASGHLHVLEWLAARGSLESLDPHVMPAAMEAACGHGQEEVVRWLVMRQPDVMLYGECILRAQWSGHHGLADWLRVFQTMVLGRQEAEVVNYRAPSTLPPLQQQQQQRRRRDQVAVRRRSPLRRLLSRIFGRPRIWAV